MKMHIYNRLVLTLLNIVTDSINSWLIFYAVPICICFYICNRKFDNINVNNSYNCNYRFVNVRILTIEYKYKCI